MAGRYTAADGAQQQAGGQAPSSRWWTSPNATRASPGVGGEPEAAEVVEAGGSAGHGRAVDPGRLHQPPHRGGDRQPGHADPLREGGLVRVVHVFEPHQERRQEVAQRGLADPTGSAHPVRSVEVHAEAHHDRAERSIGDGGLDEHTAHLVLVQEHVVRPLAGNPAARDLADGPHHGCAGQEREEPRSVRRDRGGRPEHDRDRGALSRERPPTSGRHGRGRRSDARRTRGSTRELRPRPSARRWRWWRR